MHVGVGAVSLPFIANNRPHALRVKTMVAASFIIGARRAGASTDAPAVSRKSDMATSGSSNAASCCSLRCVHCLASYTLALHAGSLGPNCCTLSCCRHNSLPGTTRVQISAHTPGPLKEQMHTSTRAPHLIDKLLRTASMQTTSIVRKANCKTD